MGGGNPVAAFILTSVIVAAGLSAVILSMMWGSGPGAAFDFNRDIGAIIFAFLFCWVATLFAGVVLGIPVLIGLRKVGLDRRPEALLPAGLAVGTLFALLLGFVFSGDFVAVAADASFIALGAGAGLAAGALWWLFAWGDRRKNG